MNHDAAQPVAFRFSSGGVSGAAVTDLGELSPLVTKQLRDCDWLILESNHDEEMLKVGGYPWFLKQRLLGREGHLSNQALSHFLAEDFDGSAAHLFLAHLSREQQPSRTRGRSCLGPRSRNDVGTAYPSPQVHLTHQHKPTIVPRAMIPRYTRPEMARIWSEENKYSKWLDVEIAVCEVLAEKGQVPTDALSEIKDKAASQSSESTRSKR